MSSRVLSCYQVLTPVCQFCTTARHSCSVVMRKLVFSASGTPRKQEQSFFTNRSMLLSQAEAFSLFARRSSLSSYSEAFFVHGQKPSFVVFISLLRHQQPFFFHSRSVLSSATAASVAAATVASASATSASATNTNQHNTLDQQQHTRVMGPHRPSNNVIGNVVGVGWFSKM